MPNQLNVIRPYWLDNEMQMEGWLCPALFRYFDDAPAELYVRAEALSK